jgi:hypothetical protein
MRIIIILILIAEFGLLNFLKEFSASWKFVA